MKYKVFRSYKEAAVAPEGFASFDWALMVLQASPEVTAVECRVSPDKRIKLDTWLVEVSTFGIEVPLCPGYTRNAKEVPITGPTGKVAFYGTPMEMARLCKEALTRYQLQLMAEAHAASA